MMNPDPVGARLAREEAGTSEHLSEAGTPSRASVLLQLFVFTAAL
jgi:hypothetical protein